MREKIWKGLGIGLICLFLLIGLLASIDLVHPIHLPVWLSATGKVVVAVVGFLLTWPFYGGFDIFSALKDAGRGDGPYYD